MHDVKDYPLEALTELVARLGMQPYRAKQLFTWLYQKQVADFGQMTTIAQKMRDRLGQELAVSRFVPAHVACSGDGSKKYVFETDDGYCIESVLIPERNHLTLCISSQIGCAMGCGFCFTGTSGLVRNLRPGEIVNQVLAVVQAEGLNDRLPNIVYMGMGEPLANYDNTVKSIRILRDPAGLNYSHRKITVSTSGLVPRIEQLGRELATNLAISLNAPSDGLRNEIMPVNRRYPLKALLKTARAYPLPPRKRITFEYIMMKGVNDSDRHARELAALLRPIRCKINLIPFNAHPAVQFEAPDEERVLAFQAILHAQHYTAPIRRSKGADIAAACGQLGKMVEGREA